MRAEKMRLTRMRAQIEAAATRLQKKLAEFEAYKVANPCKLPPLSRAFAEILVGSRLGAGQPGCAHRLVPPTRECT